MRQRTTGTWAPGKYLYIQEDAQQRWIRYASKPIGPGDPQEVSLPNVASGYRLPDATIVEDTARVYRIVTTSWITREEAEALLDMAIAQNAMEGA